MNLKSSLLPSAIAAGLLAVPALLADSTNSASLMGFTETGTKAERALEAKFDAGINRDNFRDWMKLISARPRHLGSPYDREMSEFIAGLFRSWGYETTVEEFSVLFPTPKTRLLELMGPEKFTARLAEPALAEDATSGQSAEQLPVYNAYSKDGDVTGELVYVNYGIPKDYETLAAHGIDVKGKIVIARYGGSWRGIKPKVAGEHGAIGCLIYSDPRDDGYYQGDTYPKGAWRPESGAQRGSVADMPLYAGDPLTPGVGATKDAKRVSLKDAQTITKIPVLPISYADALPFLRALAGPVAPEEWRGSLGITYHLGPSAAKVHLKLEFNWDQVPARDIIAKIPGTEFPDEWIIRGNHYDGWVNGAEDPLSGTVSVLEEARGLAELAKSGWKPKRSVVFAIWDGEEPGLIGSTEWVETHEELLKQKAAVYINSDVNKRGFLHAAGSHTLENFVNEVAREVPDPERNIPVSDRLRAENLVKSSIGERAEIRNRAGFRIDALGSGSDYSPFLQHAGIASLDIGYGGEAPGGVYHSIYDSFDHYRRFGDTDFQYTAALAKTTGRLVLRLADAEVLPFEFTAFAGTVERYAKEVAKLADDAREQIREANRLIRDNSYVLASDPTETYVPPKVKPEVPPLNFAPLQSAVAKLRESANAFEAERHRGLGNSAAPAPQREALDHALMKMEQALLNPAGLPRRPWYQHSIYAPGFYTGYGVKTLPGIREAIEEGKWVEAGQQIEATARIIEQYARQITKARDLMQAARK